VGDNWNGSFRTYGHHTMNPQLSADSEISLAIIGTHHPTNVRQSHSWRVRILVCDSDLQPHRLRFEYRRNLFVTGTNNQ
jgi:hypothetical protein